MEQMKTNIVGRWRKTKGGKKKKETKNKKINDPAQQALWQKESVQRKKGRQSH